MHRYKAVDLFSGAGGLSLGFTQTGRVEIVAAAENNPNARKTYKRNLKVPRLYSDVRTIDYAELLEAVGPIDIVIGGPPCQGFSNANRQHTTIVSMNNRLVKEYIRAICELKPQAFVMENVAMLRSQVHRFMVDETDLNDPRVMSLDLNEDMVEILPPASYFEGALEFLTNVDNNNVHAWAEGFYKIINVLYRYRINRVKFDKAIEKYREQLTIKLSEIIRLSSEEKDTSIIQENDKEMSEAILEYMQGDLPDFNQVIRAIEIPLFMQRGLTRLKEITDNNIHVYEYKMSDGSVVAVVKSYAVLDYIKCILTAEPFNYELSTEVLNAMNYGAPQRRERFIIVGISKAIGRSFTTPPPLFTENFRTVRDAISDLQVVETTTDVNSKPVVLEPQDDLSELAQMLRGRLLANHVATATTEVALSRFKALKAGQNFHDLEPELQATYSNAERTQNTIYLRLKYDEPCGTVVNVRKSMWVHPELDRAISIREAARLQTFPDSFVFEGTKDSQYQQIGNAVPPFLANAIANSIVAALDEGNDI